MSDDPDYAAMTEAEMVAECSDKAQKWATAFCQIKNKHGWTGYDIDRGLMLAWFANVIEHSHRFRTEQSETV